MLEEGDCGILVHGWVSRSTEEESGMLDQVSWESGLRICGAQRFPEGVGVQRDSLSQRG